MEEDKEFFWNVNAEPLFEREESGFLFSSFSFPLVNRERVYYESVSEG